MSVKSARDRKNLDLPTRRDRIVMAAMQKFFLAHLAHLTIKKKNGGGGKGTKVQRIFGFQKRNKKNKLVGLKRSNENLLCHKRSQQLTNTKDDDS